MAECPHSTMAASADVRWGNTRVADDDDVTENNSSDTADDFIILMGAWLWNDSRSFSMDSKLQAHVSTT